MVQMKAPGTGFSRKAGATVVVGASGFIGSHLYRALESIGIRSIGFSREKPFTLFGRARKELLRADTIYYVAGSITPALAEERPELVRADYWNLQMLLWSLIKVTHRPLVVLASSGGTVYAPDAPQPFHETAPTRPSSAYGAAKLAQERALTAADWTVPVILRFSNLYGAGQRQRRGYGVITHWAKAVHEGRPVTLIGSSSRDYLHIDDAVEALLAVHRHTASLRAARTPITLNIGSGIPVSLDELHRSFEVAAGHSIPVERRPARSFDRTDVCLDVTAAAELLGWAPRIPLREGLAQTLAAFACR
ncbi:NAD-dependent epimerase/dehydratase family protein [Streptomyces sp. NPDC085942]|uniref:NAD-dependent epimerase/dehydratase family protein n=1 Tax=Streptomyces sp. NPDC085942 TaxID=3365743 RepID=UPI0037D4ACBF